MRRSLISPGRVAPACLRFSPLHGQDNSDYLNIQDNYVHDNGNHGERVGRSVANSHVIARRRYYDAG